MTLALARATLDRAAHLRGDEATLRRLWTRARVLPVSGGQALVDATPALALHRGEDLGDDAGAGERFFLGLDAEGTPYFAVDTDDLAALGGADLRPAGLRDVGALLSDRDAGLLVHAVALANWHDTHRHCPRCGTPTIVADGGHLRRCPRDASEHYPRTDPAVIMAVLDEDDRILLGHQSQWPDRWFSTLAGFVEPGESLEQAVAREVAEETGIRVTSAQYAGSQPWPFPSSLMVGFIARAEGSVPRADGQEIAEARWYSRPALRRDVDDRSLLLPGPVSIARRLIERWYGGQLPEPDP